MFIIVGSGLLVFYQFFFFCYSSDHYDPIRLKNHTNKEKNHSPEPTTIFFFTLDQTPNDENNKEYKKEEIEHIISRSRFDQFNHTLNVMLQLSKCRIEFVVNVFQ